MQGFRDTKNERYGLALNFSGSECPKRIEILLMIGHLCIHQMDNFLTLDQKMVNLLEDARALPMKIVYAIIHRPPKRFHQAIARQRLQIDRIWVLEWLEFGQC